MKFLLSFILLLQLGCNYAFAQHYTDDEIQRYRNQATEVKIIRDKFGIPHVYGNTDADAVFGLIYAQCEDDFKRIELNYIEKLGRLSELNGEKDLFNDLQIQLLIDTAEAIEDFNNAEPWLKKLLHAHADGINYYLYNNPEVQPQLLTKFKPWYALLWTDGSIGAISTGGATLNELKNFYAPSIIQTSFISNSFTDHQTGSNGFAIAPTKSANGQALLYINPHVTFYFRPEVHMQSKEGLNTYGAVTWGQFFIYQGFNQHNGWMHTSSAVDVADLYEESVSHKDGKAFYEYEGSLHPFKERAIRIRYKTSTGFAIRNFNTYASQNGPIVAQRNGKWISLKSYNRSMQSLIQSWKRTKTKNLKEFEAVMELRANTSNNTVYADDQGNIAYWHGNFIPKRSDKYNWSQPVDGRTKETQWEGLHPIKETVHIYNPTNGWIQNCNSTPFTAAGKTSPLSTSYPAYMAPDGENFRGINAVRLLENADKLSMDQVIELGHEPTLEAFKILVPGLLKAYEKEKTTFSHLSEVIDTLKNWNYQTSVHSIATTIAVEWAQKLNSSIQKVYINQGEADQVMSTKAFVASADSKVFLSKLDETIKDLQRIYGKWEIKWGDINRFQRISSSIQAEHNDTMKSYPVGQASALWGQLASFNSRRYSNTMNRYGYSGNSFVCIVSFGPKVTAKSLLAGGNSGNKLSPNFDDQAEMYANGVFKDVLFYDEDIIKNAVRTYKPGD